MMMQLRNFFRTEGFQRSIATHVKTRYRKRMMNRHKMHVTFAVHTLSVIVTGLLLNLSPGTKANRNEYFYFIRKWQTTSSIRRLCFTWTEVMEVLRPASW